MALELAEILPSLRPSRFGRRESVADERYRSHRAIRRLLELLAADRPLLLALDHLHCSDDASIELIAALLRRSPDAPILFALAFRPSQAPSRLSAALAVPSVRRIKLGELSEDQARELLGDLEPRAVAAIYGHGGGNPFYLEQLARAGEDAWRPAAPGGNGGRTGVPAAVAASLAEELASLSETQRAFLDAAAVAGDPFEPDLAAAIAELSEPAALAALDALLALDLVRPTSVPRRFVFRHPLVRRAVVESTPGGWRLAAHARAAAALTARGAEAAECAHHVEQSASPGDEDAIALLLDAGVSDGAACSGGGRPLVRGGAAAGARRGPRAAGGRAGRARRDAALAGRARALPRRPAGGSGPASPGRAGGPSRADRALRGDRALAGPA